MGIRQLFQHAKHANRAVFLVKRGQLRNGNQDSLLADKFAECSLGGTVRVALIACLLQMAGDSETHGGGSILWPQMTMKNFSSGNSRQFSGFPQRSSHVKDLWITSMRCGTACARLKRFLAKVSRECHLASTTASTSCKLPGTCGSLLGH